jgi:predicted HNH restriction endonuclease
MTSRRRPNTPNSIIRNALRKLWLRSREHQAALKREHYTCQECGGKQSKAKGREFSVAVHHRDGIEWDGLIAIIAERLLQDESKLVVLCPTCHEKQHPELKRKEVPRADGD